MGKAGGVLARPLRSHVLLPEVLSCGDLQKLLSGMRGSIGGKAVDYRAIDAYLNPIPFKCK